MDKIITTSISDPLIQQPFTGKSLDFIQQVSTDIATSFGKNRINDYSSSVGYILYGCVDSGSAVTAGAIFYNGELYQVDAVGSYTLGMGQVLIAVAANTNHPTADPVMFTDGINRNVHNVRKLSIGAGTSGAGLFDYSNAVKLYVPDVVVVNLSAVNSNYSSSTLVFDTEVSDAEGIHNTANGRITPKKAGWYRLTCQVVAVFDPTPSASTCGIYIKKNGSTHLQPIYRDVKTTTIYDTYNFSELIEANGTTDYFEIAISDSVANYVTLSGRFALEFVRE